MFHFLGPWKRLRSASSKKDEIHACSLRPVRKRLTWQMPACTAARGRGPSARTAGCTTVCRLSPRDCNLRASRASSSSAVAMTSGGRSSNLAQNSRHLSPLPKCSMSRLLDHSHCKQQMQPGNATFARNIGTTPWALNLCTDTACLDAKLCPHLSQG